MEIGLSISNLLHQLRGRICKILTISVVEQYLYMLNQQQKDAPFVKDSRAQKSRVMGAVRKKFICSEHPKNICVLNAVNLSDSFFMCILD